MKIETPKDERGKMWGKMEKEIQSGARQKDGSFVLFGKWKKFVRIESGYKLYQVDGSWIRHNLSFYFGHGGHGLVHECIPLDEIWVSSHHPYEGKGAMMNCTCKMHKKGQKMSDKCFNSTALHELTECNQMKRGKIYWVSHNMALKKEHQAGLLRDPYDDL